MARMRVRTSIVAMCLAAGAVAAPARAGSLTEEQAFTVQHLRTYCAACHAIGDLRFIYSDDDADVWAYIHTNDAPNLNQRWVDAIVSRLSWPSETAPPATPPMDPTHNRDWMPIGEKRFDLAAEMAGDTPARDIMLRALQAP